MKASADGSLRCCSMPASHSARICSSSLGSNAGSRSTSATSASTAGRFSRVVSMEAYWPRTPGIEVDARFQPVELVRQLLARVLERAAHQHRCRHAGQSTKVLEAGLIAEAQRQRREHRAAARLLGQQRELEASGQFRAHGARLDVGGRGVEGFAGVLGRIALVILDQRDDVGRLRHFRAIGRLRGIEERRRAIRLFVVRGPDALYVGRLHGAQAIAIHEHQPPVAHAGPVAQREADVLRGIQLKLDLREDLGARALHFLVGNRLGRRLLGNGDELREHGLERLAITHLRDEARHARVMDLQAGRENGGRLAGFHDAPCACGPPACCRALR